MATTEKIIDILRGKSEPVPISKIICANTQKNIRANYTKKALNELVEQRKIVRIVLDDQSICYRLAHD